MIFFFLFILISSKNRICICNEECSVFCPAEKYIAKQVDSQINNYLKDIIIKEVKTKINLYSKKEGFSIEVDLINYEKKKNRLHHRHVIDLFSNRSYVNKQYYIMQYNIFFSILNEIWS